MAVTHTAHPISHERPAQGEAEELLGLQRIMFWMRGVGLVLFLSQVPLYERVTVQLVAVAALVVVVAMAAQRRLLTDAKPVATLRRYSLWLLGCDLAAIYLVGTAFAPSPQWIGFYFYPLIAVEGAIVAGLWGALGVTGLSTIVYLAQLQLHLLANPEPVHTVAETLGGIALVAFVGGFMGIFGLTSELGRRDLQVLLDLTSALAHQRDESETLELLDRRLRESVGARVRSVAIRGEDGRFEIVRWHSAERRRIEPHEIEHALGDIETLSTAFRAGGALTWATDAGSVITRSLGLPDWARAVTMVPIFVEGQWLGVLPVLWPTATIPNTRQLRLIYGLASQMGLSLSQGQLQRVREEAATDPLTGLANRRAILDELDAYVARATRAGTLTSLLFCDLDGFKAVNDTRGHEAGDEVLRSVAAGVRNALRQGDVVGRYGGDELLVVAADAGATEAATLASRVRAAVRAAAGEAGVDVTIGIAVYPHDGHSASELLGAADRAMYQGKLQGPGRVTLATPHPDDQGEPLAASVS